MTDEEYIDIAIEISKNAKNPYGAIVVKNNEIIGRSDDKTLMETSMFPHAELEAIESASKNKNLYGDLKDATIYVSYEMYDKYVQLRKREEDNMLHTIDIKRHMAIDIKKSFNEIYNYLKKQPDVDKELLKNADEIIKMLDIIELKYEPIIKEK